MKKKNTPTTKRESKRENNIQQQKKEALIRKRIKHKNKSVGNLRRMKIISANTQIHNTLKSNHFVQHNIKVKNKAFNYKTQDTNTYKGGSNINLYNPLTQPPANEDFDPFVLRGSSSKQSKLNNPILVSNHLYQEAKFSKKRQNLQNKERKPKMTSKNGVLFAEGVGNHVKLNKKKRSLKLFENLRLEVITDKQLNSAEMRFKSSKKKISKDNLNFNLKRRSNGSLWRTRKVGVSPRMRKISINKLKERRMSKQDFNSKNQNLNKEKILRNSRVDN